MKELEIINTIQNILNSEFIGDDCAYLKDLGLVVTQDSLVEDIHFSRKFSMLFVIFSLNWTKFTLSAQKKSLKITFLGILNERNR